MNLAAGRRTHRGVWALTLLSLLQCALAGCSRKVERVGRAHDVLRLEINDVTLTAEVACDDPSRRLGLGNRDGLPVDHGMLFIFRNAEIRKFWMKNTRIPLSIAFIDDDGKVLQIEHMKPNDLTSTLSNHKVRYALEVDEGWFKEHNIKVGDRIKGFREKVSAFRAS